MLWGTRVLIPSVGQDRLILPVCDQVLPNYGPLKVRRTLMSIARADAILLKVRRTLMFSAALRVLCIKDLKDLSVFFGVGVTIDMQVLRT